MVKEMRVSKAKSLKAIRKAIKEAKQHASLEYARTLEQYYNEVKQK